MNAASQLPLPEAFNPQVPAASNSTRIPEHLMYKNRLQEYTQKSSLPLPIYQTVNEGSQHAPSFRSTVFVDGVEYTSPNSFSHRKAAEQDVAKLAMENILKKMKDEGCPLIHEDTVFCKSILNEFAVKVKAGQLIYNTVQSKGLFPVFVSSLDFKGVTYTGDAGRTKKEAEQLAARAVIRSLFGDSGSAIILSEIIKSKDKLFAALHRVKDPQHTQCGNVLKEINNGGGSDMLVNENKVVRDPQHAQCGTVPMEVNNGRDFDMMVNENNVEAVEVGNNVPVSTIPETVSATHPPVTVSATNPPCHVFKRLRSEAPPESISLPIAFVQPVLQQPQHARAGSRFRKRRRKNKKKDRKNIDNWLPVSAAMPYSQAAACSIAQ